MNENELKEEQEIANEIAKLLGFDEAVYLGVYKKENIYMPAFFDIK